MAIFNVDYFNTLDRGYYSPQTLAEAKSNNTYSDFPEANPIETKLTGREIGTTMAPDTYPVQELQAKIRQGVAKLEIAFSGAGKSGFGGRGSTPEVLGKREREEFREMAKINDVTVSTHATFGKQGLSGLTQQGFSDEEAQKTLKEINKAIEFAATATQGGAVVFHAGEWQRPIMDAGVKNPDKVPESQRKFREYDTEYQKAPMYLADEKTGQIQALNREMKFYFPEEEFDKKTGINYIKKGPDGKFIIKEFEFDKAVEHIKNKHKDTKDFDKKTDAEVIMYGLREQQLRESEGQALRFSEGIDEIKKALQKIADQRENEERIWNATPENDRWRLMEPEPNRYMGRGSGEYIPRKDALKLEEERLKQQLIGNQSTVASALEQQQKILSEMNRFKPIEEVGIKKTADTLAKAGIKAMMETDLHKKELKEAIYIAPENLFPDFYGSQADEMIRIVEESRKDMAKKLITRGFSENDAKQKAETHIKATLDTGHLNEWRQHFKGNEKEFKKWYIDQVQKMIDKNILGHIHLTDNWGYDDEHLTPGQGNTPNKEVFQMLEKAGFKDFITEVGSFNANTILPDTLAEFGSPIYALGRNMSMGRMRHGHFGYNAPSNYIVGAYAPSNDFRLWSEVPLE
ncbi:MAG: TIM barrel protein [Candidatus Woesearchaeota archaeon]